MHARTRVRIGERESSKSPGFARYRRKPSDPKFAASASVLPFGEGTASITPSPACATGVTNSPALQSSGSGENARLERQRMMPCSSPPSRLAKARMLRPSPDQWIERVICVAGTGLHLVSIVPRLICPRQSSLSAAPVSKAIARTSRSGVGAHAGSVYTRAGSVRRRAVASGRARSKV